MRVSPFSREGPRGRTNTWGAAGGRGGSVLGGTGGGSRVEVGLGSWEERTALRARRGRGGPWRIH